MGEAARNGGASSADREDAERVASTLRALADPTRVQLLRLILGSHDGRRPVTELAAELGLSQPTVSHHLGILSQAGVLDRAQDGRRVFYSVSGERMSEVFDAVQTEPIAPSDLVLERISADLATRFRGRFSPETISGYVRESAELLAARGGMTRHLPSVTARFAADRLDALARTAESNRDSTPEVLFVCVQNAGRSQLASAMLRSLAGDRVRVRTAGSAPAGAVNPKVVESLDEIGVSVAGEFPKPLTDEVVRAADFVITMGCGDACPIYPGRTYLDWDLPDPATVSMSGIREIRDDIDRRVRTLLAEIDAVNSR